MLSHLCGCSTSPGCCGGQEQASITDGSPDDLLDDLSSIVFDIQVNRASLGGTGEGLSALSA
jgi:hypothetical protein